MWNFQDLTGNKYGKLTVIKRADDYVSPSGNRSVRWLCVCECGREKIAIGAELKRGNTQSCGCMHKAVWHNIVTKHGKHDTRIYRIWKGMLTRCYNTNHHTYANYGKRGIAVCDEWKDNFQAFYDWSMENGYTNDLSIDRIDYNKGYTPDNCRWTTTTEQANNTRKNHYITYDGKTQTMAEWAKELGIPYTLLRDRVCKLGWSIDEVISRKGGQAL